jgi:hypothetical protein
MASFFNIFQRGLLHELSNDGAQDQFEHFLEELILPQMVSPCELVFILIILSSLDSFINDDGFIFR